MRLRLYPFVFAVLVYNLAHLSPCLGGGVAYSVRRQPRSRAVLSRLPLWGERNLSPLPPLIALAVGALLLGRTRPWRIVGLFVIGIVSVLFIIGAFGEFFADHPHVPLPVVYGFGGLALLLALTLLFLVAREVRAAARRTTDK